MQFDIRQAAVRARVCAQVNFDRAGAIMHAHLVRPLIRRIYGRGSDDALTGGEASVHGLGAEVVRCAASAECRLLRIKQDGPVHMQQRALVVRTKRRFEIIQFAICGTCIYLSAAPR